MSKNKEKINQTNKQKNKKATKTKQKQKQNKKKTTIQDQLQKVVHGQTICENNI